MMRILSWSSGLGCDKVPNSDYSMMMIKEHSASALATLPTPSTVKRKRSPSFDAFVDNMRPLPSTPLSQDKLPMMQTDADQAQDVQSEHITTAEQPVQTMSGPLEGMDSSLRENCNVATSQSRLERMRQTISSQLSLEILVKHKELRLIEQEMAKCQVALEQLRRCSEIPFPCFQTPSTLVSDGNGPAVRQLGQRYPPESPAAWGVTDGPYSRHYAKWLLEDRRFDGGEPDRELIQPLSAVSASGRSTRGHYVDVLGGKSVKPRARNGSNLQALPAGYGQPKEKATGPMILKRKSDNSMVKLVCPDCGRHDFGSAQGFINHCRIGHSRSFASHDAAAEACGEPVEYNENGSIKGLEPVVNCSNTNTSVHPLVRSAKLLPQSSPVTPCARDTYVPGTKKSSVPAAKLVSPEFQASAQTPHLSALIQNQGLGLDLQHLVMDAKTKVETCESDVSEDDMDIDSPIPTVGGRHPQVAGSKQPLKSSLGQVQSGLLKTCIHPELGTQSTMRSVPSQQCADDQDGDSFSGPLPSPTNDSTQAPSLVDDDEEFDPQSPMSSGEVDEAEVDFEIHDDEQNERVGGFQSLNTQQPTCSPDTTATAAAPNTRRGLQSSDKHVTFVSPSPAPEGSDRKRRKI